MKNAQIASPPVIAILPVAVPPTPCTRPPLTRRMMSASGTSPSRLQNRMKKNSVHRNGMKRSVRSLSTGCATAFRMNSTRASSRFITDPRGVGGSPASVATYARASRGKISRHRPAATSVISNWFVK